MLTAAHKKLIKLLAAAVVEEFIDEETSRARAVTPTRPIEKERRNERNLRPIQSE